MKFNKLIVMVTIMMVAISSCQKEKPTTPPQADRGEPLVMTYEDFITPDDVQIVSNDTTKIAVSKAYAEKMGVTDFSNRAVTIWRTIGTIPFVRIITNATEENGKIVLTTTRGDFCDMFENLDLQLESDLYVNHDYVPTRATRSGSNIEADDISGKYIDEDGVYHPAVIIYEEDSPAVAHIKTKSGETKNYFTAEELLEDNLSFDIVNFNSDFLLDFAYPKLPEENDDDKSSKANDNTPPGSDARVHIKGKIGVNAKLSAYANVKIGWFKLKMFEAGVKGKAGVAAKLSVGVEKKIRKEWEKTLVNLGSVTSVFIVGFVPVPYTVKSAIKEKVEAEAAASIQIYASAKYNLEFEKGCLYESGKWVSTSKKTKSDFSAGFDGVKGEAKLSAEAATVYELSIKIAGSAGPVISVGPKVSAEATVEADIPVEEESIEITGSAGLYAGLHGEIGAEVRILGYTLARWKTEVDLFNTTLWEGGFNEKYTNGEWSNLELEWNNLLNKGSGEWEWTKSAAPRAPYRLPDSEMNF